MLSVVRGNYLCLPCPVLSCRKIVVVLIVKEFLKALPLKYIEGGDWVGVGVGWGGVIFLISKKLLKKIVYKVVFQLGVLGCCCCSEFL